MLFSKEGSREEDKNQFSCYVLISMLLKYNYISWQQRPQDRARFWSESQAGQFGLNQLFVTACMISCIDIIHLFPFVVTSCGALAAITGSLNFFVLGFKPESSPWLWNLKINTPALFELSS